MKYKFIILMLLVSFTGASAQVMGNASMLGEKEMKLYQEAVKLVRQGKLNDAEKKFNKLLQKVPGFYEAELRKGAMYFDQGLFDKAALSFDLVIGKSPEYDAEMYYAAAVNALQQKEEIKAVDYYKTYLEKGQPEAVRASKIAQEIKTLTFRIDARKNPKPFQPKPLEGLINSKNSEYLPFPSLDGKTMIFTRRLDGQEDLYISKLGDAGTWSVPESIEIINTSDNEAAHTMSADGRTIIFTGCNNKTTGFGSCDLYWSSLENGQFTRPVNMGPRVNTPAWESQPCLVEDGNALIFASNRRGGYGGNDLWITRKQRDGKWNLPNNLGPEINTPQHEESPFLHRDGHTLYFRSNGHIGMGGFDLFVSRWSKNRKEWTTPENLGYPINTEGDEGSLTVDRHGINAFFASDILSFQTDRKQLDILTFVLPAESRPEAVSFVQVVVSDFESGKPLEAGYVLLDVETGDTLSSGNAIQGSFMSTIISGHNYGLRISMDGYLFHSENFNTTDSLDTHHPFVLHVALKHVSAATPKPIVLHNIFFVSGSAELLPASGNELDALAALLNQNADMDIRITGHTDNVGEEKSNQQLSEARARSVQQALSDRGITKARLLIEGKGESEPIADNETAEGRSQNRRTEFTIVKK
ncbi:MAG: OmpA family protein [Saprospiraceae bacterium]|nr:OmpA family protein [Saprospiraceae bacterium]